MQLKLGRILEPYLDIQCPCNHRTVVSHIIRHFIWCAVIYEGPGKTVAILWFTLGKGHYTMNLLAVWQWLWPLRPYLQPVSWQWDRGGPGGSPSHIDHTTGSAVWGEVMRTQLGVTGRGRGGDREWEREWVSEWERLTQQGCFCISSSFHSHYPASPSKPQVVYHCELLMVASAMITSWNISAFTLLTENSLAPRGREEGLDDRS